MSEPREEKFMLIEINGERHCLYKTDNPRCDKCSVKDYCIDRDDNAVKCKMYGNWIFRKMREDEIYSVECKQG